MTTYYGIYYSLLLLLWNHPYSAIRYFSSIQFCFAIFLRARIQIFGELFLWFFFSAFVQRLKSKKKKKISAFWRIKKIEHLNAGNTKMLLKLLLRIFLWNMSMRAVTVVFKSYHREHVYEIISVYVCVFELRSRVWDII